MIARARGWLVGFLAALALVYFLTPVDRLRIDRVLVVAVVVGALFGVRREFRGASRPSPSWAEPVRDPGPPDPLAVRLSRLRAMVALASADGEHFDTTFRPFLRELAHERLAHVHGIDLASQPERARHVMGEELWQTVSAPARAAAGEKGPGGEAVARLVRRVATM